MTVKELKEQTEWMPDNYELSIVNMNLIQEDAGANIVDIQPDHNNRLIIITIS